MSLKEIVEKYQVGLDKKNVVILEVPGEIKEKLEDLLVDGYVILPKNKSIYVFYIYNLSDLSKRTGLDFSNKIKRR